MPCLMSACSQSSGTDFPCCLISIFFQGAYHGCVGVRRIYCACAPTHSLVGDIVLNLVSVVALPELHVLDVVHQRVVLVLWALLLFFVARLLFPV